MPPTRFSVQPLEKQRGFTLVELLVILGVVGLLVALCLSAHGTATNQTKRAQCAGNLRQFTLALQILANESQERFPTNFGYWAFDIAADIGTFVESTGSKWTVMYCPAASPRFSETDNWNLYNYTSGYRVLGYANTLPGNQSVIETNVNPTLAPSPLQVGFGIYVTPLVSERVLLADTTISQPGQNNPATRYNYNFTDIYSGYPKTYGSAHLNGHFPAGGNVGMLDGHVEWRKFDDMTPRTGVNSPVFWW